MTKHASFGLASGTTCVNEDAALTWLLSETLLNNDIVWDVLSKLQEVFPLVNAVIRQIGGKFLLAVDDEGLYALDLLFTVLDEPVEHLQGLNDNDFSFGVFDLVEARFWRIGKVDTRINTVVQDTSREGDGPLWRVEPHHCHRRLLNDFEGSTGLRKSHRRRVVLIPVPGEDFAFALNEHASSVASGLDSI